MTEAPAVTPPPFARIVDTAPDGYKGRHRAHNDGTPRPSTVEARAHTPKHAATNQEG